MVVTSLEELVESARTFTEIQKTDYLAGCRGLLDLFRAIRISTSGQMTSENKSRGIKCVLCEFAPTEASEIKKQILVFTRDLQSAINSGFEEFEGEYGAALGPARSRISSTPHFLQGITKSADAIVFDPRNTDGRKPMSRDNE